jgi:hypothetical protein
LRKATPQKDTLRRSKKSPRMKMSVACGLSVRGAPNYPVAHWTVRCTRNRSPTASSRWHFGGKTTGLSGVMSGLSGVKRSAPTVTCSDRPTARRTGLGTVRCPVHHRTVRCDRRKQRLSSNGYNYVGGYKYTPNWPFPSVGAQEIYQGI